MLTVGSLFTGVYGIELGLERTGYFRTIWMVENDEFCRKVLRKHRLEIPLYGDIRTIDWATMPRVDMLAGGFPCQDISCANPRGEGIEGSRSGLWKEYAKAIGVLRPKYALVENVPAIVRKGLDVVLADLAEAGYDAEWFDLRASDFGAPHRRERIFVVAFLADTPSSRLRPYFEKEIQGFNGFSWCKDVRRVEDLRGRQDIPEPLFRGARDGVPDWVDRIKALGNAVVPDCAEFIGEMIMEFDKKRKEFA